MINKFTIYSNDGETILDEITLDGDSGGIVAIEYGVGYDVGCEYGIPYGRAIFNTIGLEGGIYTWVYNGSGYFKGFAFSANATTPDIDESSCPIGIPANTDLYVVDVSEPVRVYLGESEDEPLMSIVSGRKGVVCCKNKIMPEDIYIRVANQETDLDVQVYMGERLLCNIVNGLTGVIKCKDKIMPDDIYIECRISDEET